jgi:hypothetical protein
MLLAKVSKHKLRDTEIAKRMEYTYVAPISCKYVCTPTLAVRGSAQRVRLIYASCPVCVSLRSTQRDRIMCSFLIIATDDDDERSDDYCSFVFVASPPMQRRWPGQRPFQPDAKETLLLYNHAKT